MSENANFRNYESLTMGNKARIEELVALRARGQVPLPRFIREKLHLEEGSLVLIKIVENAVVMVPQETVDKDQSWFWRERWQKLEADGARVNDRYRFTFEYAEKGEIILRVVGPHNSALKKP